MDFDYCKNCSRYEHCGMRTPCGHFEPKKPKTNFSRVTSSPETLAEFIAEKCNCINCPTDCPAKELCADDHRICRRAMVVWLKQESE